MKPINKLEIENGTSLRDWRQSLRMVFWNRDLPYVRFALPNLTTPINLEYSDRANRLKSDCACTTSSVLMAATAVILLFAYFISGLSVSDIGLIVVLKFFGAMILAGCVGKIFGLVWNRFQLITLAEHIYTQNLLFHHDEATNTA